MMKVLATLGKLADHQHVSPAISPAVDHHVPDNFQRKGCITVPCAKIGTI